MRETMTGKRTLILVVAAVFMFGSWAAADAATSLTYSIFFPPAHAQAKAAESWAKEIEKRSAGAVKISLFPGGTLTPADQCYDGVVKGISDIGMSAFAYTRGRFPQMEALDLPLGYPNGRVATRVANEFYLAMKPKALEHVKVLYLHAHGPGLLHTKKPVKTLEDLKGMKIRSTGFSARVVTALGAVPVAMPQGETYEALSKGIADGTIGPIEVLKGWKQGEVIKSTTDCFDVGYTTAFFVVMNLKKWNSLPPDVKKVFEDVSREWIDVHGKAWDEADREGRDFTKSLGNRIIPLSAQESARWKKAVRPTIEEYIKDAEKKGVPGRKSVKEAEGLIAKFRKQYK
ncbi:MAG: 2,3-diketo-L-gulonate-binding periplasmic protein YiaO precursor [Syntrophaceae bacterium PtaB.Bin038]|nr:MAG: 2,3-diketo-L-gulonate-binding periplasmic protein YiaO precursor [Syntrophaceae bacterium PtaB.Bin038]